MKPKQVFNILLGASVAHGAVNTAGVRVVEPVSPGDPVPISDPLTYIPDQHDCPLPCSVDYTNVHKWTQYNSIGRLARCGQPMLLHFSALYPLDNPQTDILIRSCSLGDDDVTTQDRTIRNATAILIDNPKKFGNGMVQSSLNTSPACVINGTEVNGELLLGTSGGQGSNQNNSQSIQDLLDGLGQFFEAQDNCDETFAFAYYQGAAASIYIGPGLGKPTVSSALQAVASQFQSTGSSPERAVAEICGGGRGPESVFGLSITTAGNFPLLEVQKMAASWSQGNCVTTNGTGSWAQTTLSTKVFQIAADVTTRGNNGTISTNSTTNTATIVNRAYSWPRLSSLHKRDTCKYVQVVSGDGCSSLATKCGISGADLEKYNKDDLCSTLMPGDYVCCSEGDPYTEPKPDPPSQNEDGTCASHYIVHGDTCSALAKTYGITVDDIESFNKGKTWGYTSCDSLLLKYNMCVSDGTPPLPPPQQGAECGPLVPGTVASGNVSMADLNPCPLNACCSNWGFCGPFPAHCDIHAPEDGGPGSKLPGFNNTCISNCGTDIKQNSGPPETFSRIGYYESWNFNRPCLWLKSENANVDGSYTHIHWSFLEINSDDWSVVLKDPHDQWEGFKALSDVKKIVSFGGWAYSTEAATYNIMREAIITNADTFASNIAKFLSDENLDGVDIDWEYPGAPDIAVNGEPISQEGDGAAYLNFLKIVKEKIGTKSVSIAAPASYWYLKAFPIDQIGAVIDYIVYMTYDLHGQWDYGNVNAFDSCDSGKCIRSHVNLTETRNSLSIITKAGVPNNKIFVGESSYGRSFHMAVDGCSGPTCEFTGTREQSDAKPGRCTETGGYISNAEINELINNGNGVLSHDDDSDSDILLYDGDYISYMTPTTKETRRTDWQGLNFAGTIDWALDLQSFGSDDADVPADNPVAGEQGCVSGESADLNADDLCQFSCNYGFCPESICTCTLQGTVEPLPDVVSDAEFIAYDEFDVDLQRLCKFSCKYGFCPDTTCGQPVVDDWDDGSVDAVSSNATGGMYDKYGNYEMNRWQCMIFKTGKNRDTSAKQCYNNACKATVEDAKAEGRTTNYGCVGNFPIDEPIPWASYPGTSDPDMVYVTGQCSCDNALVNTIADTIIEALPIIAQIGCYIVMSTLKLVLDVGLEFITGGTILDAGMDAVASAAQLLSYAYPEDQDPAGAFEWWLSPCGGSDLVPDDIKQIFDILNMIPDGVSSFKKPNFAKGSGRKGDDANPTDRSKPKEGTGSGPSGTGSSGVTRKRKCNVAPGQATKIMGAPSNTLRLQSCAPAANGASTTTKEDYVITSINFGTQPTTVSKVCSQKWSQACYHYSSAIVQNPSWKVLPCVHGNIRSPFTARPGVSAWYRQHDESWRQVADRKQDRCDADEYPPRYLLADSDIEMVNAGKPGGQLMRYLPDKENQGAGGMWKGACFVPHVADLSPAEFNKKWAAGKNKNTVSKGGISKFQAEIDVDVKPYFEISKFEHESNPPADDGIYDNKCWPVNKAADDPGFALFKWDNWYSANMNLYDFTKPYSKGSNGA